MWQRLTLHRRLWLYTGLLTAALAIVMMISTTPQSVGPAGVLAWFGLAYICIVTLPTSLQAHLKKSQYVSWRIAAQWCLVGFGVVGVLGLRSLGQLQARDILLLVVLVILLSLYLKRVRRQRSHQDQ